MKNILKHIALGIAWGCTIYTLISLSILFTAGDKFMDIPASRAITHIFCSMAVGIGYSLPSMVYKSESLPFPLKVLIHMGTGTIVYAVSACIAGWIPTDGGFIVAVLFFALALLASFLIWLGFWLYYRNEAKKIQKKLKEI